MVPLSPFQRVLHASSEARGGHDASGCQRPIARSDTLTLRITCGPRRARALRASVGGVRVRSRRRKAPDRPGRQVNPLVGPLHFRDHFLLISGTIAKTSRGDTCVGVSVMATGEKPGQEQVNTMLFCQME